MVRSASRKIATFCSSVNRHFLMGSSGDEAVLSGNQCLGEVGQVTAPQIFGPNLETDSSTNGFSGRSGLILLRVPAALIGRLEI